MSDRLTLPEIFEMENVSDTSVTTDQRGGAKSTASGTPRTDEFAIVNFGAIPDSLPTIGIWAHARQLERELNAARAATIEQCAKVCDAIGYHEHDECGEKVRALDWAEVIEVSVCLDTAVRQRDEALLAQAAKDLMLATGTAAKIEVQD